ncbi:energy transducer TonB [Pelosinus sp. UFO1]|uniref:energy transducer TonB n=1 Tax=Pelosinus sp. UFO1 TaxID=484770 RepID=UPI0004D1361D|nr:energy transducer TonB [Pelosinus sp. UFO1]AIF50571.1 TonB family protein [Pelosinus sp. UFO1]
MIRPRLRKSIVISVIFHILLLGIVGLLAGRFFPLMDSETYIELELLTDTVAEGAQSNESSPVAKNTPQTAAYPETTTVIKSTTALSVAPKAVAVTEDLAVVAVEAASTFQSMSDNGQGSNSSNTSTTDGGTGNGSGKGTAGNSGGGNGNSGSNSGNKQITRPSILSKVDPDYPETARTAGLEGTVLVKIQILANGLAGDITVNHSSGHGILDEAAIVAVRQWRFIPAKNQENVSIMCYTTMPISFRLK